MGNVNEKVEAASTSQTGAKEEPKKLKPCCACPETKRVRDAWYFKFLGNLRLILIVFFQYN